MVESSTGEVFKLSEADDIKIDYDKIKVSEDGEKELIANLKKSFELVENLNSVMKNADDEAEITLCLPDYGAVFSASIKSAGLGTFAHNILRVFTFFVYKKQFGRVAENDSNEWTTGIRD